MVEADSTAVIRTPQDTRRCCGAIDLTPPLTL
jgi:hypothetical protein